MRQQELSNATYLVKSSIFSWNFVTKTFKDSSFWRSESIHQKKNLLVNCVLFSQQMCETILGGIIRENQRQEISIIGEIHTDYPWIVSTK